MRILECVADRAYNKMIGLRAELRSDTSVRQDPSHKEKRE